jgi:hypothetical protein
MQSLQWNLTDSLNLTAMYRIYSGNLRTFFLVWPLKNRGA